MMLHTRTKTLVSEAGIQGRGKKLHSTIYSGVKLLKHAIDTCFLRQSPHIYKLMLHKVHQSRRYSLN